MLEPQAAPMDVVAVIEVLERIAQALCAICQRLRALSSRGAMLIPASYHEKQLLYDYDKPHGHMRSFEDTKIEIPFGIYADYRRRWNFALVHGALRQPERLDFFAFTERARGLLHLAALHPTSEWMGL